MKHLVSYSGGLNSFETAVRVVEKYGKNNVLYELLDSVVECLLRKNPNLELKFK